jgi:hypothetical protein
MRTKKSESEIAAIRERLFERIEKEVSAWPYEAWLFERIEQEISASVEATETFIAEIAEDLLPLKGEDAPHFAARLLITQVAWRKSKEAFDAGCDEYERGEAGQ